MNNLNNETNYFSKKGFVKIKLEKNTLKYFSKLKKNIKHKFKNNFKNNSFEKFHKSVSFNNYPLINRRGRFVRVRDPDAP